MMVKEEQYWGDTSQSTIDFAYLQCAKNRARMEREKETEKSLQKLRLLRKTDESK